MSISISPYIIIVYVYTYTYICMFIFFGVTIDIEARLDWARAEAMPSASAALYSSTCTALDVFKSAALADVQKSKLERRKYTSAAH